MAETGWYTSSRSVRVHSFVASRTQEEIRFQVDREIFAKILKVRTILHIAKLNCIEVCGRRQPRVAFQDDRDAYKYEVNLLVQKVTELQKEKHELFVWAKEQQQRHLQEIRKLTRALSRTKRIVEEQVGRLLALAQTPVRLNHRMFTWCS